MSSRVGQIWQFDAQAGGLGPEFSGVYLVVERRAAHPGSEHKLVPIDGRTDVRMFVHEPSDGMEVVRSWRRLA